MLVTLFKQLNLVTLKSFRFEQLVRTVLLITVVAIIFSSIPLPLCHSQRRKLFFRVLNKLRPIQRF